MSGPIVIRTCVTDTSSGRITWAFVKGKWRRRLPYICDAIRFGNYSLKGEIVDRAIISSCEQTVRGVEVIAPYRRRKALDIA